MTITIRKDRKCYFTIRQLSCFIIGCGVLIIIFISKYPESSPTCSPINLDNEIIDRQDEWKYQNSITGQWYHWRTVYKKQTNDIEWRVNWLNTAPTSSLGVIVYLTRRSELSLLNISLAQLSLLLINNPRPVVIFHEGDFNDNDIQQSLAQTLGSHTPLAFERIQFSNSSTRPKSRMRRVPFSYMNMCRFFTLMLPNHPLVTLFSFYWRLDAHSYIFGPKPIEDPFEIMQKRHIQYAFTMVNEEGEDFARTLWSFFQKFLNDLCLKDSAAFRQTQTDWFGGYSYAILYSNFEIINASLFRDHSLIRAWLHRVERNGGIYRYRWGDAPLHTLALTQFLERDQILCLRYFGYMHRTEYACPSGIKSDLCKQELRSILRDPTIEFTDLKDGCRPRRNPLCHYYPEIRL